MYRVKMWLSQLKGGNTSLCYTMLYFYIKENFQMTKKRILLPGWVLPSNILFSVWWSLIYSMIAPQWSAKLLFLLYWWPTESFFCTQVLGKYLFYISWCFFASKVFSPLLKWWITFHPTIWRIQSKKFLSNRNFGSCKLRKVFINETKFCLCGHFEKSFSTIGRHHDLNVTTITWFFEDLFKVKSVNFGVFRKHCKHIDAMIHYKIESFLLSRYLLSLKVTLDLSGSWWSYFALKTLYLLYAFLFFAVAR